MEDKCRNACIFYEEIHILFILYEFCLSNYLVINIAFFCENGLHGSSMPYEEFLKVIQIRISNINQVIVDRCIASYEYKSIRTFPGMHP